MKNWKAYNRKKKNLNKKKEAKSTRDHTRDFTISEVKSLKKWNGLFSKFSGFIEMNNYNNWEGLIFLQGLSTISYEL